MAASLRAASSNVSNRTVHVKIFPSARTFAERREVLRVLERFGEVTMFRSLKHHPISPVQNAFISIFSSATAAQEVINASPVRYRLVVEPDPQASSTAPSDGNAPPQKPNEKVFSLSLNITRYTHDQYISHPLTNPLYGLEPSMWSKGLADWDSDAGKRSAWNDEDKDGGEEENSLRKRRHDSSSSSVPLRLVEKDLEARRERRPKVMEGLMGIVGEGNR
ncbi:hypothetical protein H4I96_08773 [Botrytis cinerea]